VPCGIEDEQVTSLEDHLADQCPGLDLVRETMMRHFSDVCGRSIDRIFRVRTPADLDTDALNP
jgi:lipoate-protein ligase B